MKRTKSPAAPAFDGARLIEPVPFGVKAVAGFCLLCLAAMLVASFIYRLERPDLRVNVVMDKGRGAPPGMGQGMGQGMDPDKTPAAMTEMMEMMASLKDNPNDFGVLMRLAERFLAMDSPERAVIFFERAAKVKPDDPEVLNGLGVAYFQADNPQKSRETFERLLAVSAGDYRAHFNLGILLKHAFGDQPGARKHFQAVLDSKDASAENKARAKTEMETAPPTHGQAKPQG